MPAQGESRGSLGRETAVFHSDEVAHAYTTLGRIRRLLEELSLEISALSKKEMRARALLEETAVGEQEDLFRGIV